MTGAGAGTRANSGRHPPLCGVHVVVAGRRRRRAQAIIGKGWGGGGSMEEGPPQLGRSAGA